MFTKIVVVVFVAVIASGSAFRSGCRFELNHASDSPVLIDDQKAFSSYQDPETKKWFYETNSGNSFRAKCLDSKKRIGRENSNEVELECVLGSVIRTPKGLQRFDSLDCSLALVEEVYRNGTCYNGYTNVEIAFNDAETPYSLITVCHNENLDETLFVKSHIRGADLDDSESINRPSFKEGGFFSLIAADDCYSQAGQIETVTELLGSKELVDEYIQTGSNLFMSRGHLCPNGDGIEAYEKKATFYFLNTVPQWQTINGGNWNQLEITAREIAGQRQALLTVYTGGYGVTTLDDVNGNPVELWLGKDSDGNLLKRLPVPHLTWKVIHDEKEGDAIAVIQVNNPWNEVKPEHILCEDICDQVPWVDWKVRDVRLGYTYCCDVASFYKAVPYAPNLGSLPLMTN